MHNYIKGSCDYHSNIILLLVSIYNEVTLKYCNTMNKS